nr:hypothetical protein C1892_15990 [Pseudomonas sp. MPBD7-1]
MDRVKPEQTGWLPGRLREQARSHNWIGVQPGASGRLSGRLAFDFDLGHIEPKRGTQWWGKALLVTLGALSKVTRCKSGALSSRYRSNGYVQKTQPGSQAATCSRYHAYR